MGVYKIYKSGILEIEDGKHAIAETGRAFSQHITSIRFYGNLSKQG
ncbi:MAG: hypothetical protein CM15mV146_170 [uncultured marine virus]|nr:MAG: hypothetical protein CM15mV146_170 [uncultured marine virus]